MKTKEEIIQSLYGISINSDKRVPMGKDECIRCMQEYADQEKAALKEKIKLICQEARMDDRISAVTAKLIIDQF